MILVGNARGGAKDLALHLMKDENDHVELHELRGFASDTLMGALNEAYAMSRGTRCRKFLYSLSLNPPETEQVGVPVFEAAIERVEKELGLEGQPRAVVFHEMEGRRHAHCVWSRIDAAEMKAVQLSFDHTKLTGVSRELFLEHGWDMPPGLVNASERDPRTFTLAEWQQAKRAGRNARDIKTAIQDAWAISDNRASFLHAMEERGFKVARGDRGRFVAVDHHGEVWSVPKQANVKTRAVRERLGDAVNLPAVHEAKAEFAAEMYAMMERHQSELATARETERAELHEEKQRLVERQREERRALAAEQDARKRNEALLRQARFRKGLSGLWDRLRGEHKRIRDRNEREAKDAAARDARQKDALVFDHLSQRQTLKLRIAQCRDQYAAKRLELQDDRAQFEMQRSESLQALRDDVMKRNKDVGPRRRTPGRQRGPEPEL